VNNFQQTELTFVVTAGENKWEPIIIDDKQEEGEDNYGELLYFPKKRTFIQTNENNKRMHV